MYFSKVLVNPELRKSRAMLADPHITHGMVTKAVPPHMQSSGDGRILWRADRGDTETALYLVTPVQPRLDHIVEQVGWPSAPAQTTDYVRFLDSLRRGQEYAFKVTLNPVKAIKDEQGKQHKVPHVSVKHQMQWFLERTDGWGFRIPNASNDNQESAELVEVLMSDFPKNVNIVRREELRFNRRNGENGTNRVVHRVATFEGVLEVTDPEQLRHSLSHGMGRAKAYGCGLMTLARVQ